MNGVVVALEDWWTVWPEAQPLMAANYAEAELNTRVPFEIAADLAGQMQLAGSMKIITARVPQLVGYLFWFLAPRMDSAMTLIAQEGPWYVTPEWRKRGVAMALMRKGIEELRQIGVNLLFLHDRQPVGGPDLAPIFARLGAKPDQRQWLMEL